MTYCVINGLDNNRVVGQFDSKKEAIESIKYREVADHWEGIFDNFDDYEDQFFIIDSKQMEKAVRSKGNRVLTYFT